MESYRPGPMETMKIFRLEVPKWTTLLVGSDNDSVDLLSDAGRGSLRA